MACRHSCQLSKISISGLEPLPLEHALQMVSEIGLMLLAFNQSFFFFFFSPDRTGGFSALLYFLSPTKKNVIYSTVARNGSL